MLPVDAGHRGGNAATGLSARPMPAAVPEGAFDLDEILAGLERWVRIDSPTFDRDGVNRMMDVASEAAGAMGAEIERHPGRDGFGDAVVARMRAGRDEPGILVLTHLDTVHARGIVPERALLRARGRPCSSGRRSWT